MIIFLRILFIAVAVLFSFFNYLNVSLIAALIASAAALAISFSLLIAIEYAAHTYSARSIVAALTGLLIGLTLASLVNIALMPIVNQLAPDYAAMTRPLVYYLFGFSVMMFFVINCDDIAYFDKISPSKQDENEKLISYKILDTSVIIDGRISDICDTGFLEGILVIPNFILNELQMIADSPDSIKRNRGRRGLDILNKMQKDQSIMVKISDADFPEIGEVDAKLVKLAKVMKAKVITNDFNLNKVAEFHGVPVLNINQLSNALKPVVLPGEEMRVTLIKEGKDPNQAIGYLDDGTMVVVENGRRRLNEDVQVNVTSVLQTTAGRMIFTRLRED